MTQPTAPPIVVLTRRVPDAVRLAGATVRVLGDGIPQRGDVLRAIAGASVVVTMFSDVVDAEFLDAAGPSLRGVCNFAVGYNNIDLEACAERGVLVTNTPDAVTEGTADCAWMLLLAAARRLVEAQRHVRTGAFTREGPLGMADLMGADLTGRTLLIVGAGRIGYAVAARSIGWGMRVLYVARSRHWEFEIAPIAATRMSLDDGLEQADVVSIHTPLTEQTHHLIDAEALGRMKSNAILVNTSRGPVVDEAALVDALRDRRIYAAGLDVFENEPEVHPGLLELDNVVLTPHYGSAEERYRVEMTRMVEANALAILEGSAPPNRVGA
jgi:glyoxylate reductase